MDITTDWVKAPKQIGGLDHLAVQAPCINIYGQLLPGITNVSDRARYYSFYPWLIKALEQDGYRKFDDEFIANFRRADGLFTLIAHQHVEGVEDGSDHSAATVGSNNLAGIIKRLHLGEAVSLDDYAHRETEPRPYFRNKLGGLGQYYLGVLSELDILLGTVSKGVKYTRQVGEPLADAMEASVPGALFLQTLREGTVTLKRLTELAAFCPCCLLSSDAELGRLRDLFMGDNSCDLDSSTRYQSLRMLLDLADSLSAKTLPLDVHHFRGSVYTGSSPDGADWSLPESLHLIRECWGIYQCNELMAVAFQGLFFSLLGACEAADQNFHNARSVAEWFVNESQEIETIKLELSLDQSFSDLMLDSDSWLPSRNDWQDDLHEITLAEHIVDLCRGNQKEHNRSRVLLASIRLLIALAVRPETGKGYGTLVFPEDYFRGYPLNLNAFLQAVKGRWASLSLRELLICWFCEWGIDAHFKVAFRKLRSQGQETFRIRPMDHGLQVVDVPAAVNTSPRFHQAVRILKDLGLLESDGVLTRCTQAGRKYLQGEQNG